MNQSVKDFYQKSTVILKGTPSEKEIKNLFQEINQFAHTSTGQKLNFKERSFVEAIKSDIQKKEISLGVDVNY